MHACTVGLGALGLAALLLAVPAPASARWFTIPGVCLVNTMTGQEMTLSEYGSRAATSEFRASNGACPLGVEEGLKNEVKEQAMEWALGLRTELQLDAGKSASDSRKPVHRSFFLKASRKRILLGFGMQW